MTDTILRNVNLQTVTYEIIQKECERRRNGGKGFSLTLNQLIQEWAELNEFINFKILNSTENSANTHD